MVQHIKSVQQKSAAFQEEQEDIDRRLLIVTQAETSDDAVQKFAGSMERLHKLEVAAGYVELLKEVDILRTECLSQLGKSDDAALQPYVRLQQLVASLRPLQETAEGAAPHLLDHVAESVQTLRHTIQTSFSENLEKTLKKMNWPKSTDTVPLALQKEWETNIARLLDLQKQDLEERERDTRRDPAEDPPALLPLEVLVQPLSQRFTYHFTGEKATNRLDKPEYFLTHVLDLISKYADFVQDNLQPVLLAHFRRSDLAFTPAYLDATSALITALMPLLVRKLRSFASQIADQPSLLSHLVQEVLSFDTVISETYSYTPSSPSLPWRGLAHVLLDEDGLNYFPAWLRAEQSFALGRYHSIVEETSAGELDFDASDSSTTKPTRAAIRVNDLLETITERYRSLSSFSQKVRFLIDIQLEIFDRYHRRLQAGLESWLGMTSTVGARLSGITKEQQAELQGVRGLDRICRIFGSAEYLERAMRDWSDDLFFLDLWAELEFRSANGGKVMGNWQEVQRKTSSALGVSGENGGLKGALFDETAASYHRLRVRSEGVLVDTITYDIRQALKSYTSIGTWASLSNSSQSVSSELDATLQLINEYFSFLKRAVGKTTLRRISRQVCILLQTVISDGVLLSNRNSFSTAGAAQLTSDLRALCNSVDRYVGAGQAQIGMRKLVDGIALLSLPVRGESKEDGEDETEGSPMSLFQAERLVFMSNESARHALEQLGLECLSEVDARSVLGKRVEISS